MLKVFYKTYREKLAEVEDNAFYPNFDNVCATYVINKDGKRIDTDDLTEAQILSFATQGIYESVAAKREAKNWECQSLREARKLMDVVADVYRPSLEGLKQIVSLLKNDDNDVEYFAGQVLYQTAAFHSDYNEVLTIANYLKESKGEFTPVTRDEMVAVIEQMQVNEKSRNQARGIDL